MGKLIYLFFRGGPHEQEKEQLEDLTTKGKSGAARKILRGERSNTDNTKNVGGIDPLGTATWGDPEEKESQEQILEARRKHEANNREVNSEALPRPKTQCPQRATEGIPEYYAQD